MIRTRIVAADLAIGDRTSSNGKSRVSQIHNHRGNILVKIETRGTRSPTVESYAPTDTISVWR